MDLVAAICTALRWRRHRLGLPQRVSEASFWDRRRGERPRNPNAPQLDGTGEIRLESADRANGYFGASAGASAISTTSRDGVASGISASPATT